MIMSLVRLLAAGKSLVGMRDTASRYRMNKQGMLPKFVSPKNPFATPAESEPAPKKTGAAPQRAPGRTPSAAGPAGATPKSGPRCARSLSLAGVARWLGERLRKLNPLPQLSKPSPPVKPAPRQITKTVIQDELRLDNVKVIRNDLSDADLEVVPVAAGPAKQIGAEPILRTAGRLPPSAKTWSRLTTRLLGVRAT
jgi:hypothetical protein